MADTYLHTLLTPAVRDAQCEFYGRDYPRVDPAPGGDPLGDDERSFIEKRDSFYMATVNEDGWPYLQHRGGEPGFVRLASPQEIEFDDYPGNRQLISVGNLRSDDRVSLFFMDYTHRMRLKVLGWARDAPAGQGEGPGARPERTVRIRVLSFDWNCPKFITPRYTHAEWEEALEHMHHGA